MLSLISSIVMRVQANRQRIVLPEGIEECTSKVANQVLTDKAISLTFSGNSGETNTATAKWGLGSINRAAIIDPGNHPKKEEYAQLLCELRREKGMTIEKARKLVLDPLYLDCLIIKSGDAGGQLAGARNTMGDVFHLTLQIIKTSPGAICMPGAVLLLTHTPECGQNGLLVIRDAVVTPVPDTSQLAQIVVCTARTARAVAGIADPKVAMLSFSTKSSAKHENTDKVVKTLKLAKEITPDLNIDGEMQADAALVLSVAASEVFGSLVVGEANVPIMPSLEVGNISCKLVQRLRRVDAVGLTFQDIARPIDDPSCGCSIEDVYRMIAIIANRAIATGNGR